MDINIKRIAIFIVSLGFLLLTFGSERAAAASQTVELSDTQVEDIVRRSYQ